MLLYCRISVLCINVFTFCLSNVNLISILYELKYEILNSNVYIVIMYRLGMHECDYVKSDKMVDLLRDKNNKFFCRRCGKEVKIEDVHSKVLERYHVNK